ncbi:hypothetical protein J2W42_005051 [Rhizobium tibeticum]|uniref:hypothetical protein n=1 Tax=Rhizobium tibeticum TaxID=501024 RepID=UPI002788D62E|nr:hypothetical protein [Rhizobium tibeticum]MDP9812181.1 hypothetical protein [Rhizobium tibeticum]
MSVLHKSVAAGLMALTLTGASLIPATPANANSDFWGGVAAGAVGGILLSQVARPYPYYGYYPGAYYRPYYNSYYRPYYGYGYRPYYRPYSAYRNPHRPYYSRYYYAPRCHVEWRRSGWGEAYRTRVCY